MIENRVRDLIGDWKAMSEQARKAGHIEYADLLDLRTAELEQALSAYS